MKWSSRKHHQKYDTNYYKTARMKGYEAICECSRKGNSEYFYFLIENNKYNAQVAARRQE